MIVEVVKVKFDIKPLPPMQYYWEGSKNGPIQQEINYWEDEDARPEDDLWLEDEDPNED